jgi:toxin ParE1/3/4
VILNKLRFSQKGDGGRDKRNHYLNQFDDAFYLLADVPSAGMEFSYIKKGHRIFLQGSHVIFYKAGSECKI